VGMFFGQLIQLRHLCYAPGISENAALKIPPGYLSNAAI
jgi:hypothetical protein